MYTKKQTNKNVIMMDNITMRMRKGQTLTLCNFCSHAMIAPRLVSSHHFPLLMIHRAAASAGETIGGGDRHQCVDACGLADW